jgi:hypothetical protein
VRKLNIGAYSITSLAWFCVTGAIRLKPVHTFEGAVEWRVA